MKTDGEKIKKILERGVSEIMDRGHLERALYSGKKLRVKFGIDPTSSDLHLGHAVLLRKLRQFQEAGHKTALIIGDFTAQIGDPSGRGEARKPLSEAEIKDNLKKYLALAGKIINIRKSKIFYNSKWLGKDAKTILSIARAGSVQYVARREDFRNRIAENKDITLLEALYPLFQGYDSVVVKADVEIGGSDQKLNLLAGRKMQRYFGQPEEDILMMPLLEGIDGARKMSKSFGNYISLGEEPGKMFAKIMAVPDALIEKYFLLLTDLSETEISQIKNEPFLNQKKMLAGEIVASLCSRGDSQRARKNFEETFSKKGVPENLETRRAKPGEKWAEFLIRGNFVKSKSGAKRLIENGGVDFDGQKISKAGEKITKAGTAKIGKYKFIKIKI